MRTIILLVLALSTIAGGQEAPERVWTETFDEKAEDFASTGRNPYFVLEPGFVLELEGREDDGALRLVITVLDETKKVAGIETRVVEERESLDGALVEVSRNYFAISRRTNNVYYFGEEVDVYRDGEVVGHGGAWLAGEKGARYGLMMPGIPLTGARYYQEIAPDAAMDRAEILSVDETYETPAGKFERVLKIEETTPLEPGDRSVKVHAPGIGLIRDGAAKLVMYGKAEGEKK